MDYLDVYLNARWIPLRDADIKPGKYLCKFESKTFEDNIGILEITENTHSDGGWIILNGTTERIENLINNYLVAGPIIIFNDNPNK